MLTKNDGQPATAAQQTNFELTPSPSVTSQPIHANVAFDIRNFTEKLEPAKEKGKYICPVCQDDNLGINEKNGAYKCWSTGCEPKAIRDAISPPLSFKPDEPVKRKPAKTRKEKAKAVVSDAVEVEVEVDHLAMTIASGNETLEHAMITLTSWCKQYGHDKFAATQLLRAKVTELKKSRPSSANDPDEQHKILRDYRLIERRLGDGLRLNSLLKQVELEGKHLDPNTAKVDLIVDYDCAPKSSSEDVGRIVIKLAKKNSYNPVVDYLNDVYLQHGDDIDVLENFASRYFKTTHPIYEVFIRKFLIGACKRAFEPGCKHDSVLILQGDQEAYKSTFFETLASKPWFTDSLGKSSQEKDEILKVHCCWIAEWAEIDRLFGKKEASDIKAFITSSTDLVRPHYGRTFEYMNRQSVLVGTTNEQDFLIDPTGNRRFWVISIPSAVKIDIQTLKEERDKIWAAAMSLYRAGEKHYLTSVEEALAKESRKQFEQRDPWYEAIAAWVAPLERTSTKDILANVLQVDVWNQNRGHQNRVAGVLKQLGWKQQGRFKENGEMSRIWVLDAAEKL